MAPPPVDYAHATMSSASEESNRRLLRARDVMDGSYARPLDIPALARIAMTSEAHFSRTFKATFGETPHRYLQRRRVERAMFLLRNTGRDVTEVRDFWHFILRLHVFEEGFVKVGECFDVFFSTVGNIVELVFHFGSK